MDKKKVYLDEDFWEGFVYSHPKKFLNETLKKKSKQENLPSGRSDLTFRDKNNNLVIVELQMNALDRKHLAQTIEYKMDWEKRGETNIRMILLCNEIRENRKKYIEEWDRKFKLNLETKSIPIDEVKEIIKQIDPRLEFVDSKEETDDYYYYDKKEVRAFKEKKIISKKNDLEKALDFKKFKNYHKILDPYLIENTSFLNDIQFWHKRRRNYSTDDNISNDLYKLINELKEMEYTNERFFSEIRTVENILNSIEQQPNYRKLLYNPHIINHKKLFNEKTNTLRKAKVDLVIYTDHYFGRKNFRLYWIPSEWKFISKFDENKRKEILEKYEKLKNDAIAEEEKKLGRKLKTDGWYSEMSKYERGSLESWNIDAIREKNIGLNKIRTWIDQSDFAFNGHHAEWFKYNKDDHLILEIKDAFGDYMDYREGRFQNFWGRVGVSLLGLISKIFVELSENFEVNIKGGLKFFTADLTEKEKLLVDSSYKNYKCVYGFSIKEANHDLDPEFVHSSRDFF